LAIVSAPGAQDVSTLQESAVMKRAVFGGVASRNGYSVLTLRLLPPEGERTFQSSSALALAFGYILPGAD
jgi:hypothetical protein